MTETKVPLDTVVKHLSDTLSQHDSAIRKIEQSIESVRSQMDIQLNTIRQDTNQEFQALETKLTDLIASKDTAWTQVSDNIHSLNNGLQELKNLFMHHFNTQSPALDHPVTTTVPTTIQTPVHTIPPPFVNTSLSTSYTVPQTTPQMSTTIVLPPTTTLPTFSGKPTERPRQFLLRVEEYARTINNWSRETLLRGISQFLKDDAFDWYCQLYHTNNVPTDWNQFVTRFLAQFHSPLRAAHQEQDWIDCKQQENEPINEFVVRLRSLWLEQKPDESESDFIKHLFCKMRPDLLNSMNFSLSSSVEAIISEAQKIEEILFLRSREQRQRDLLKGKPNTTTNYFNSSSPVPTYTSNRFRAFNRHGPTHSSLSQQSSRTAITCWRCYEPGHYSTECPLNNDNHITTSTTTQNAGSQSSYPLPPRQKNI